MNTHDELGRMDSIAVDGGHGIGMQRGSRAGANAARDRCGRCGCRDHTQQRTDGDLAQPVGEDLAVGAELRSARTCR
jgi:hypothetical protein